MSGPGTADSVVEPSGGRLSLRVQTVLFHTELATLERFVTGISRACEQARKDGAVGRTVLSVGDCSPTPMAGATDAIERLGARGFDEVAYVHFGENLGHGGAHNRLSGGPSADLALVINPDTYASPTLVRELVVGLGPDIGLVEARQLPLEHPKAYDPVTGETSWASGSCVLIRAAVFVRTGGFDPGTFFMHVDDVDLSWRARLAGFRVVHRPTARVFHDKRLTAEGTLEIGEAEVRWSEEARVLLAWRYDRHDLAMETLAAMEAAGDPGVRSAAADLRSRIEADSMPGVLPGAATVAEFVDGEYAVHRFGYGDP